MMPCRRRPMDPRGRLPVRSKRDGAFRRAEDVDDPDTETRCGGLDDLWRPLVAEGDAQGVVGVVRPRRSGQQIRQQLAGVVEPGGAVVAHVGKEPRRAEATGQGKRGAGHQRRSESGHQRVGVEQGHRRVADVLRSELEHHGHPVARGQQSTLRAAHRLGRGRRSGCEEQRPESVHVGVGRSSPALTSRFVIGPGCLQCLLERLTRGRRLVPVGETVRDEDPSRECHSLGARSQLLLVTRLGDDELDVGVRDVLAEMLAPTRVVQPCHGDTGQARTAERKDVVGRVVQQKADVGGTTRVEPGAVQRGKALRFGQKFPMSPLEVPKGGQDGRHAGNRAVAT